MTNVSLPVNNGFGSNSPVPGEGLESTRLQPNGSFGS